MVRSVCNQCCSKGGPCPLTPVFFTPKVKTDMYQMLKIKSHLSVPSHNFPLNNLSVYVFISPIYIRTFFFLYNNMEIKSAFASKATQTV